MSHDYILKMDDKFNLFIDDSSYIDFRQSIIDSPVLTYDKSKLPFENIFYPPKKYPTQLKNIVKSLIPVHYYLNRHLFYLNKKGICRAHGYYIPETKRFVICMGSLLCTSVNSEYEKSNSGSLRAYHIQHACEKYPNYYVVKKNIICLSPTSAASYVLGRVARYTDWKDENGDTLDKFYAYKFV